MSEETRIPRSSADVRNQAFRLIRTCWLPLLLALMLMQIPAWINNGIRQQQKAAGQQAHQALMADFYAKNPAPEDPDELIEWHYFDEYLALSVAQDKQEEAQRPYHFASLGMQLLDFLIRGVLLTGLYRILLKAHRGEAFRLRDLFHWLLHPLRPLGMSLQILLRMTGYLLLGLIGALLLGRFLGNFGAGVGVLALLVLVIWVEWRYSLASAHLSDDAAREFTPGDCIRASIRDFTDFGPGAFVAVIWPALAIVGADLVLNLAGLAVPALAKAGAVIDPICTFLSWGLQYAFFTCIYEEMRQRFVSRSAHEPVNPGLERARQLAALDSSAIPSAAMLPSDTQENTP